MVVAKHVKNSMEKQMCKLIVDLARVLGRLSLRCLEGDHHLAQVSDLVRRRNEAGLLELGQVDHRKRQHVGRLILTGKLAVEVVDLMVVGDD